jgi:hypothetical protein
MFFKYKNQKETKDENIKTPFFFHYYLVYFLMPTFKVGIFIFENSLILFILCPKNYIAS